MCNQQSPWKSNNEFFHEFVVYKKSKGTYLAYLLGFICKKIMDVFALYFKAVVFGLCSKTSIILSQLVSLSNKI